MSFAEAQYQPVVLEAESEVILPGNRQPCTRPRQTLVEVRLTAAIDCR